MIPFHTNRLRSTLSEYLNILFQSKLLRISPAFLALPSPEVLQAASTSRFTVEILSSDLCRIRLRCLVGKIVGSGSDKLSAQSRRSLLQAAPKGKNGRAKMRLMNADKAQAVVALPRNNCWTSPCISEYIRFVWLSKSFPPMQWITVLTEAESPGDILRCA